MPQIGLKIMHQKKQKDAYFCCLSYHLWRTIHSSKIWNKGQCSSCHGKNRLNDGVRNCVSQWVHEKKERNRDTCWVQNHDISISGFLESYENCQLGWYIFCYHNHHFRYDRVLMVVFLNHDNFLNSCFVLLGAFIIIFLQWKDEFRLMPSSIVG